MAEVSMGLHLSFEFTFLLWPYTEVYTFTSTYDKKEKEFKTPFGTFTYRDVPKMFTILV